MRASFLVIGALLAREGYARVSMPGGCAIGTRPVDIHLNGLKTLGADIKVEKGFVIAEAKKGLTGNRIQLEKPSVGATQNLIMASTIAKGETKISNASIEPEVLDLIDCLKKMGANIEVDKKIYLSMGKKHFMVHRIQLCLTGLRLQLCNRSMYYKRKFNITGLRSKKLGITSSSPEKYWFPNKRNR